MRVVIADDESLARSRLRSLTEELGGCQIVGEAASGDEVLGLCRRELPDVLLLDISMPGMDGLEVAQHLTDQEQPPAIIFTTAYSEHALEAFAAQAVDYLLKPIQRERLEQAFANARRLTRAQAAALQSSLGEARTHLAATHRGDVTLIPVQDIIYLRAEHKYVSVAHTGGEALVEESLKGLESEFPDRFIRTHRNTLVAADRLLGLEKDTHGGWRVVLAETDERPEVSRRHATPLRRRLRTSGKTQKN